MSREALAWILGRAALDARYLARLKRNPVAAAKEMKVKLRPDQKRKLKSMDYKSLGEFNKLIKNKRLHETFEGDG